MIFEKPPDFSGGFFIVKYFCGKAGRKEETLPPSRLSGE